MGTKRFVGSLISVLLAVAVICTGVKHSQAAVAHAHPMCGSSCSCSEEQHADATWQAWDGSGWLYSNRYYYLTQDVTLDAYALPLSYDSKLHLCLNGHTVTCEGVVEDMWIDSLQLLDCTGTGKVIGTWGNNAAWKVQRNTLTISGTGDLDSEWSGRYYPWTAFHSGFETVVIEPGITGIPRYTFEYCENIKSVTLPDTVTDLNLHAFQDCGSLNHLLLPASLRSIDGYSYNHDNNYTILRCERLTDLYYSGTVEAWNTLLDGGSIHSLDSVMTIHFLELYEQAPTCTTPGLQMHYRFDDTSVHSQIYDVNMQLVEKPQTVPQLGHDYITHEAQVPTCEAVGWNAYETCARCEYTSYEEIPMLRHEYAPVFTWGEDYSSCEVALSCKCGLQAILKGSVLEENTDPSVTVYTALLEYDGQVFTDTRVCEHYAVGDLDSAEGVDEKDAIYLLMHVLMSEDFPLNQDADFDKDGIIDENDAIYLLMHVLFPDAFPL